MKSPIYNDLSQRVQQTPRIRIYQFIFRWGVVFTPAVRPKGMRLGAAKRCFVNAANVVMRYDNEEHPTPFLYAEGLALAPGGMLFEHAWCVRDNFAIDPTLRDGLEYAYMGIVIPNKLLARLQNTYQLYGCLGYARGKEFMQRWDDVNGDIDRLMAMYKL